MESAFGVDHGEVSKAIPGFGALGSAIARKTTGLGGRLQGAGAANSGAARAMGKPPTPGMKRTKGALGAAGGAQSAVGGRLSQLGGGMMKRPGLTGGVAAGGAAAGAGGGAAAYGNRNKRF